jgi:2-methylcitrate dehydratase
MREIKVKVHPSSTNLKKQDQLAWQIAEIATDKSKASGDAIDMVVNRLIDNASVAIASFYRNP